MAPTFTMRDFVTTSMRPLSGTVTAPEPHKSNEATASADTVTFTTPTTHQWKWLQNPANDRTLVISGISVSNDSKEKCWEKGHMAPSHWYPLAFAPKLDPHLRLLESCSSWRSCARWHTNKMWFVHQTGGWGCNVRKMLVLQWSVPGANNTF